MGNDFSRKLSWWGGLALVAAPLLTVIGTFFWDNGVVSRTTGVFQHYASYAWIFAFFMLFTWIGDRKPTYAFVGLVLGVLGCFGSSNFAQEGLYINAFSMDPAVARTTIQSESSFILTVFLPGMLFPLGIFLAGLGLKLAKRAETWICIMICVGALAFPVSRIPRMMSVALVADLLLLIPMVTLAMSQLRAERSTGSAAAVA